MHVLCWWVSRQGAEEICHNTQMNIFHRECLQAVKKVEPSNSAIRKEQTSIAKAIKELEELMREGQKKSFTLKGSGYEVNVDVCNLSTFFSSVNRLSNNFTPFFIRLSFTGDTSPMDIPCTTVDGETTISDTSTSSKVHFIPLAIISTVLCSDTSRLISDSPDDECTTI